SNVLTASAALEYIAGSTSVPFGVCIRRSEGLRSRIEASFVASFFWAALSRSSSSPIAAPPARSRSRGYEGCDGSRDDLRLPARGAHDLDRATARREVDRLSAPPAVDGHRRGGGRMRRSLGRRRGRSPMEESEAAAGAPPEPDDPDEHQQEEEPEDDRVDRRTSDVRGPEPDPARRHRDRLDRRRTRARFAREQDDAAPTGAGREGEGEIRRRGGRDRGRGHRADRQ